MFKAIWGNTVGVECLKNHSMIITYQAVFWQLNKRAYLGLKFILTLGINEVLKNFKVDTRCAPIEKDQNKR